MTATRSCTSLRFLYSASNFTSVIPYFDLSHLRRPTLRERITERIRQLDGLPRRSQTLTQTRGMEATRMPSSPMRVHTGKSHSCKQSICSIQQAKSKVERNSKLIYSTFLGTRMVRVAQYLLPFLAGSHAGPAERASMAYNPPSLFS
jgi:hypothetical protein